MGTEITLHRLGFTGTQLGCTEKQLTAVAELFTKIRHLGIEWQHNGDCTGADEQAGKVWQELGGKIHLHPPSNPAKRAFLPAQAQEPAKGYLDRNRDIVLCATVMVATPAQFREQRRGGTWFTIRYALEMKRKVWIVFPDGSMEIR